MAPLSRFRALLQGNSSVAGENYSSQRSHHPPASPPLDDEIPSTPGSNETSPSRRYAQIAQGLRSSLPSTTRRLAPEDVDFVGEHPIASGEFANIWRAVHDGRTVILKSYRCCVSSDATQVIERFHGEVHLWTLLHHRGVDVVPLVGVYSTEAHPFGLVYEYLDNSNLRQYLRNKPNVGRLELLAGIARDLNRLHSLGIVHGNIQTANILISKDGTTRITGLGNASVPPNSTTWVVGSRSRADRLSRNRAPEMTGLGESQNATDHTYSTKDGDMYAFGVMTWEVLTGRPPFPEMTEIAATYSMLSGARPPRPSHPEISDRVWYMIERCWDGIPSKRMSAGEVVSTLETELGYGSDSCLPSHN